jgi:Na+-driven multidrug efflux pump
VFFGYGMILSQALNGAGNTKTPTIINFIFFWLVEIPLAWVLAMVLHWGQVGVYISIITAETMLALAVIWAFKQGKWKTVKV